MKATKQKNTVLLNLIMLGVFDSVIFCPVRLQLVQWEETLSLAEQGFSDCHRPLGMFQVNTD